MGQLSFDDMVGVGEDVLAALRPITSFQTLNDAINWGIALSPPSIFLDAVIQDEYTHDVIFSYGGSFYLVWDAT